MMTKMCKDKVLECVTNLHEWMSKAQVKVVTTASAEVSRCESMNNGSLIVFAKDINQCTVGHEYGHSIFHAVFQKYGLYPDCSAIKDKCHTWDDEWCVGDIVASYLDHIRERCNVNVDNDDLAPLADIMGMYVGDEVPNYKCHPYNYAAMFNNRYNGMNLIHEDEWFAGICGLMYEGNWKGLRILHKLYPVAVESCFDILDKAMEILKERAKEMRDKYFISTADTFVCIEIPLDVLTLLHLKLICWCFCI